MAATNLTAAQHEHSESHVRTYLMVFCWLLVFTILEYFYAKFAARYQFHIAMLILGLMVLAIVKATMVAMFFMHLKGEKPLVFWSLGLTGVLCAALFAFLLWTEGDRLAGTRFLDAFGSAPRTAPSEGVH